MRTLSQTVLGYIRKHELLKAGDRVGAAVSGGADSVGMLRLLLELRREIGIVLSVVHFNHRLRGAESDADEQFVAELARRNQLELQGEGADVACHVAKKRLSIETAARDLRYAYFRRLLEEDRMNRIATAHTLDDQAETVLMRVVRGAGTRGLAGIYPQLSFGSPQFSGGSQLSATNCQEKPAIVRPLLGVRRKDLECYLRTLGQAWREDSSNLDMGHTRNRVRHEILPRLEISLNPAVREALAETAEIARTEEDYWKREVDRRLPALWNSAERSLRLKILTSLPLALQRRVIRAAGESLGLRLDFRQVEDALEVSLEGAKSAELSVGWRVGRRKGGLCFEHSQSTVAPKKKDYEYRLSVPGEVVLPETGTQIEARLVPETKGEGHSSQDLLDPKAATGQLIARNWRAGDRFWPAHTKAPKKIKELLVEMRISGAERLLWPVLVSGSEIVWVRGLPTPEHLRPGRGSKGALAIHERPLSRES